MDITISFTAEEWAAFSARVEDPEAWIRHAAKNKIRKCMDWVLREDFEIYPVKKTHEQKIELLKGKKIKTRLERKKNHPQ